jgi:hypothetical protein
MYENLRVYKIHKSSGYLLLSSNYIVLFNIVVVCILIIDLYYFTVFKVFDEKLPTVQGRLVGVPGAGYVPCFTGSAAPLISCW